jgi:hypothetical protein
LSTHVFECLFIYDCAGKNNSWKNYITPFFYSFSLPLGFADPLSCLKDFGYKGINPIFLEQEDERANT